MKSDQKPQDLPICDWPEWIFSAGPDMSEVLSYFTDVRERFWHSVKEDYNHESVYQAQINETVEKLTEQGVMDSDARAPKSVGISSEVFYAWLNDYAKSLRIFSVLCVTKKIIIVQFLDAFKDAVTNNSLLVAFGCLRSLIEHIAHLNSFIADISKHFVTDTFDEALAALKDMTGVLVKKGYATRIDWNAIMACEIADMLKKETYKYKQNGIFADREAESMMKPIDKLGRSVEDIRGVYEILCDFVHPNVGEFFALTRSAELVTDDQGVYWTRKKISLNAPMSGVKDAGRVFNQIFIKIADCLKHSEMLLGEAESQKEMIARTVRLVLHQILTTQEQIKVDPYALCPCGSGQKIKFCLSTQS